MIYPKGGVSLTYEQISALEPIFGKWNVEDTVAEGKNTTVFKVSCYENSKRISNAVEAIKFPGSNEEILSALDSGRFATVDEYLSYAEKKICENIEAMMAFSQSRNIVNYYDYTIVKESNCFYVLILRELMTPLNEYIKDRDLKHKEIVKLGWDVCNAIEEFRQAGIVHKSITPENIFIGDNSSFKLGDFGIDRAYRRKSGMEIYRAPEVIAGKEGTSEDIYALGMVLYRLANNNRSPFLPAYPAPVSFEDRERAASRRLRGDMFPKPENADNGLARIIFTATAFRPEERYPTPSHMKNALETYVRNALTEKAKPKPVYVPEHSPVPARTDGAASVSVKDKAAFAEAFRDDEDTAEDKNNKKWYIVIGILVVILAVMVGIIIGITSGKEDSDSVAAPGYTDSVSDTTDSSLGVTEPFTEEGTTSDGENTTAPEELTTEETTTEPSTTEELTTEEVTTEEATTSDVTEDTTQEITLPNSQPPENGVIEPGDVAASGKVYTQLTECGIVLDPQQSNTDNVIVIQIGAMNGNDPKFVKKPVIYYGEPGVPYVNYSELAVTSIEEDGGYYMCDFIAIDETFSYEPEIYAYYIVIPEGAIETDSAISMEHRLDF